MNLLLPILYFTIFAVIAGGAFAMMWGNLQSINEEMRKPKKPQHPEAPKEGDETYFEEILEGQLSGVINKYKMGLIEFRDSNDEPVGISSI